MILRRDFLSLRVERAENESFDYSGTDRLNRRDVDTQEYKINHILNKFQASDYSYTEEYLNRILFDLGDD